MTEGTNQKYDKVVEWKNWATFINNTHLRLDEIERIGERAYFDKRYLNVFFAKLKLFCSNRKAFIEDYKKITQILDNVGDQLFSPNYLHDFNKNKPNQDIINFQYNSMKKLIQVLEILSIELSESQLTYKVSKVMKEKEQNKKMKGVTM